MMHASTPLRIINTRPARQAKQLTEKLIHYGAQVISIPTLNIEFFTEPQIAIQIPKSFFIESKSNYLFFTSQNAVLAFAPFLKNKKNNLSEKIKIAAIGQGTASTLNEVGINCDVIVNPPFNSESLLAMSDVLDYIKQITIITGEKGRSSTFLREALLNLGINVHLITTYRRIKPNLTAEFLQNLPDLNSIDVIIITSADSLDNFITLFSAQKEALLASQLLMISTRLAEYAQFLGFRKEIWVSDRASDEALLHCLSTKFKKEEIRESS